MAHLVYKHQQQKKVKLFFFSIRYSSWK
jgi:hypothetical protein